MDGPEEEQQLTTVERHVIAFFIALKIIVTLAMVIGFAFLLS